MTRDNRTNESFESVILDVAEALEREQSLAREAEQALSYILFFDAIEGEIDRAA